MRSQVSKLRRNKSQALTSVRTKLFAHPRIRLVKHANIKISLHDLPYRVIMRVIDWRGSAVDVGVSRHDSSRCKFHILAEDQVAPKTTQFNQR